MKRNKPDASRERQFERAALRAAFVSLFAFAFERRKSREDYKKQMLADGLGIDKSAISRWFSGAYPNWQIDSIADIADELGIEIQVCARERATGATITPHGVAEAPQEARPSPVSIGPKPVFLMIQVGGQSKSMPVVVPSAA
jgi:hypothetical protein